MKKSLLRKMGYVLLVSVLVFLAACQNQTDESKKPEEKAADTQTAENKDAAAMNSGTAVPTVKQLKDFTGKVSPAFTGQDLTTAPTDQWITNGGTVYNQRYSPLDTINTSNVSQLKGKWTTTFGSGKEFKYSGEAQPLVYDGVMYVIDGADDVLALDAKTGETIWEYHPHISNELTTVCCGWTSRGVAIGEGKVFVGLLDARLVALDQKTGEVVWETTVADWKKGYTITSAPLYYDGKLYTGLAGGEYGIRGRVTSFDAETGRELWRFYTIPGPGEIGFETWPKDNKAWMKGGAPVWQTPAVDPETNTLYFSTGNAAPDLDGSEREGDNLFSASIVAIDAQTGKYKWHFQEVHHDIWDLDAPNPVILFDINMDGQERKALGQAGKTGWVYLLDRITGKPLIGIDEKPVPQEPKQKTSATQPYPVGDSFVPQTVTEDDLKKDIPDFKGKFGNIFTPFWEEPVLVKPSPLGGANWPPSAYNPDTELFYVLGNDKYFTATRSEQELKEGSEYWGSVIAPVNDSPTRGFITAIDVKTNKIAWQVPWDDTAYSGALTTKGGLLFVGHNDGRFIAYDAKTGKQLWEFQTGAGVNAPATTYEIDGVQYVTVLSTGNSLAGSKHGDTVWTFALDGKIESGKTPDSKSDTASGDKTATTDASAGDSDNGKTLYENNCLACHGTDGRDGHNGPNLQESSVTGDASKVIDKIKKGGTTMPSFKGTLSDAEMNDLAAYITSLHKK